MGPHVPPLGCLSSSPGLGRPPCCLLFLAVLGLHWGAQDSSLLQRIHLVVASRGYSLDLAPGLLFAVASLVMEHGI